MFMINGFIKGCEFIRTSISTLIMKSENESYSILEEIHITNLNHLLPKFKSTYRRQLKIEIRIFH